MSVSANTRLIRQVSVGGALGLIVGILVGLLIGWVVWPVEYEQAYTYQLIDEQKQQYVAAVADSYNLTKQVEVAQQRFEAWTTEEKVSALARLFAENQAQGKAQEAERVAELSAELQRREGWDPTIVGRVINQLANEYVNRGETAKAQAVSLFAGVLTASGVAPPLPPATAAPQAQIPLVGNVGTLLLLCGVLLLIAALILVVLVFSRRRPGKRAAVKRLEPEWRGAGPPPLLQKTTSYSFGMDNLDESFAIETEDNEWLGECGMGISESLGDGAPRRVVAFEVWLFDKPNTRTVTKVLMSDFAYNNEALRNKLSSRGEPVLATPSETVTLETPALTVKAQIVEMEYGEGMPAAGDPKRASSRNAMVEMERGEGMPAYGYFNSLTVSLTAHRKPEAGVSSPGPVPPGMGAA